MYIEVTRYAGLRKGEWSAIAKVKVLSPEICLNVSLCQEVLYSGARIATHDKGECVSGVPGSKSIAGYSMVHNGTWESHIVPNSEASNKSKRRRRKYGDIAVGLTHSRGVNGVMLIESKEFGTLEGFSSKAQRDEQRIPYPEMDNITLTILPSYLNGLGRDAIIALAGTE
jgi:hypothetical protein